MERTTWCPHCGDGPSVSERNDRPTGKPVCEFPCGTQIIGDTVIRMDDCYKREIRRLEIKVETQAKQLNKLKAEINELRGRLL